MSKRKKRNLIFIIVTVLLVAALAVLMIVLNTTSSATVNVYQVKDLTMSSEKETSVTKGKVTNNMSQSVKLENDEKVSSVYVKKGDKISIGDKLFTYDLRSLNIELKNKRLQVEEASVSLYNANLELKKLQKTKPVEDTKTSSADTSETDKKLNSTVNGLMVPYKGSGTKSSPYTYLVASGSCITSNYMKSRCINRAESRYEVLEYRENDKFKGILIYAVELTFKKDGTFDVSLSQTENGFNITPGVDDEYTTSQLTYAINQKQIEISNYELDKSIAENDYAKTLNKIRNATVYAAVSGTVKTLRTQDDAKTTGDAFIEIIGKRGYYVQGYISELQLSDISKGNTVKIKNVADNVNCSGVIVAVSEYPTDETVDSTAGNTNVSYYPFTVEVGANENLKIGDEIEINLSKDSDKIEYILKSFVRQEGDIHYVLIADSSGVLQKRTVITGSTLYGEYIEIKSGITNSDWLAFPYGKDVKTGLKTVHSTQEQLFGDMY